MMPQKIQPIRMHESRCIFVIIPRNLPIDHCNSTVSRPTFSSCVEIPASSFPLLFETFEASDSQLFHSGYILNDQKVDVFVEEQRNARAVKTHLNYARLNSFLRNVFYTDVFAQKKLSKDIFVPKFVIDKINSNSTCRTIQGVIVLTISNRPCVLRSSCFEIIRAITP